MAFLIDFDRRPYNSRTTVRVCDLLLENKNCDFLLKDKNRFELKEQKTFRLSISRGRKPRGICTCELRDSSNDVHFWTS